MVVWRTWVIWGKNHNIIIFPTICAIGGIGRISSFRSFVSRSDVTASSIVSGIGLVRSFANVPTGEAIYNSDVNNWFSSFGALTCAINIYAVAAISYKTWYGSKQLSAGSAADTSQGERATTPLIGEFDNWRWRLLWRAFDSYRVWYGILPHPRKSFEYRL